MDSCIVSPQPLILAVLDTRLLNYIIQSENMASIYPIHIQYHGNLLNSYILSLIFAFLEVCASWHCQQHSLKPQTGL